eukprot:CAMPEP_0117665916 /NCGR_PEP_ID=MMETSP0804-20121206/10079_1 /TAXON_ID=1074897 /ORGANISM="Tetraselmis astigmatica, Strain CCMP880" /LENGTH=93 /DNA_ID=CAMNT_0005473389 /DNA_START=383 /DNA_END=664 /DNA_ORIENTATION=-
MSLPVSQQLLRDAAHQRVLGIGVCQEGADGEEDFRDGQGRAPLILEDVQADLPIVVDVAVVDARPKGDLWRLERVVCWEVDVEEKHASAVRGS